MTPTTTTGTLTTPGGESGQPREQQQATAGPNGHVLLTADTCTCSKDGNCAICDCGLAVCGLCWAVENELDGPCVPKAADEPAAMATELRAWREAVTAERLDALDKAIARIGTEDVGDGAEAVRGMMEYASLVDLLTALRALVAVDGDAGKGCGAGCR